MNSTTEYYSLPRKEVFELIAGKPSNILECGCGFGELGKLIKRNWSCNLIGLELNPEAEGYLKTIYDRFYITDLESFDISQLNATFDCIIYADILEHLRSPEKILKEHLRYLRSGGQVIISIPNIRNLKVIADLLIRGEWNYGDSGILDRTHYKFFTIKTLKQLLTNCDLRVDVMKSNKDQFKGLKMVGAAIPYLFVPELKVCQWLIRATKK